MTRDVGEQRRAEEESSSWSRKPRLSWQPFFRTARFIHGSRDELELIFLIILPLKLENMSSGGFFNRMLGKLSLSGKFCPSSTATIFLQPYALARLEPSRRTPSPIKLLFRFRKQVIRRRVSRVSFISLPPGAFIAENQRLAGRLQPGHESQPGPQGGQLLGLPQGG
jgi:hypothetical protein